MLRRPSEPAAFCGQLVITGRVTYPGGLKVKAPVPVAWVDANLRHRVHRKRAFQSMVEFEPQTVGLANDAWGGVYLRARELGVRP